MKVVRNWRFPRIFRLCPARCHNIIRRHNTTRRNISLRKQLRSPMPRRRIHSTAARSPRPNPVPRKRLRNMMRRNQRLNTAPRNQPRSTAPRNLHRNTTLSSKPRTIVPSNPRNTTTPSNRRAASNHNSRQPHPQAAKAAFLRSTEACPANLTVIQTKVVSHRQRPSR